MIVKKHREYDFSRHKNMFMIVSQSEKDMWNELREISLQHSKETVWIYVHHTRPAKGIPLPEYSMEIIIDNTRKEYNFYKISPWSIPPWMN